MPMRRAVGEGQAAHRRPAGRLHDLAGHEELAHAHALVGVELHVHRSDEAVCLLAGVGSNRIAQLTGEGLGVGLELLEVGRADGDLEVVGRR